MALSNAALVSLSFLTSLEPLSLAAASNCCFSVSRVLPSATLPLDESWSLPASVTRLANAACASARVFAVCEAFTASMAWRNALVYSVAVCVVRVFVRAVERMMSMPPAGHAGVAPCTGSSSFPNAARVVSSATLPLDVS